jgi:CubicO group peptidase (beta-lactamase class C family)
MRPAALVLLSVFAFACMTHATPDTSEEPPTGDSPSSSKTLPTAIKELDAFVAQRLQERGLVGLGVAVASDTGVILHRGFGYADKQRAVPATADTLFDAASVSKVFTATAVMQLAERGRIDIDAPLVRYLPSFSMKSRFESSSSDITVRHLLAHHSGLPAELAKGLLAPHPEPGAHTRRCAQLARDLKTAHLSYPPNYTMSYSNLGFSLLGCLVAEVSGQSFPDYMQQHVLRKAGMTASTFASSPAVEDRVAKPYVRGEEVGRLHARDLPAGALITTARDMGLFLKAYLDESTDTLLSRPSRQSMVTPQNAMVRRDLDYEIGLGWSLGDRGFENCGTFAFHDGGKPGVSSLLLISPDAKIGVALLSNTGSAHPALYEIGHEVLRVMYESLKGFTPKAREAPRPIDVPHGELTRLEGLYANEMLGLFEIQASESGLQLVASGKQLKLTPYSNGLFRFPPGEIPLELGLTVVDGDVVAPVYFQGFSVWVWTGRRIERHPHSEVWKSRAGRYELVEGLERTAFYPWFEIRYEDGLLFADTEFGGPTRLTLLPSTEDECLTAGLGRGADETFSFEDRDGTTYLTYSGLTYRKRDDANAADAQPTTE